MGFDGAALAVDAAGSLEIASLSPRYAAGSLTPLDVIDAVYDRIEAWADPALFVSLLPRAQARREAAALGAHDASRPLWGIPCAIKDNIDAAGFATSLACPEASSVPTGDAAAVAALRRSGAIVIGKTNLDQFATGLNGTRSPYGTPRSPVRPDLIPGGSSSGSGVAVAAGLVSFTLGTDTAGSGRVPAALGGIVGLKPSRGLVSAAGVFPACASLDCVSVFALTVADAARVTACIAGPDDRDPYSRDLATVPTRLPAVSLAGRAFAVPADVDREFFGEIRFGPAWADALAALRAEGARLVEIPMGPFYAAGSMLYGGAWLAERRAAIATALPPDSGVLDASVREILAAGEGIGAADVFEGLRAVRGLTREAHAALKDVDALLAPTIGGVYTVDQMRADPIVRNQRLGRFTTFTNLVDLAAVAVPARRVDGVPFGVTLHAPAGGDAELAALAAAVERTLGEPLAVTAWRRMPEPEPLTDVSGTTDLVAVVGAHLRGQPLHPELLACGARFVRTAHTSPDYRLYALPGTAPAKPGMIREPAAGAPLEVELYALDDAGIGRLLRSVPRPLALGRVVLEDGGECIGFVCDPAAVRGAVDITSYGGWRAFVATTA